jgi:hypothetical protein
MTRSAGAWICARKPAVTSLLRGRPAGNKFFENGDFATTETLSCRLHKKATFDVALDKLEQMKAVM